MGKYNIAGIAVLVLALQLSSNIIAQDTSDLSLRSALKIAEENNFRLNRFQREISVVRAAGRASWWPENPGFSVEWEGVPTGKRLDQYEERRLTLSQEIEFPLNIYWRNRLAAQHTRSAIMRYEGEKNALRSSVITAFVHFQAVLARERLAKERLQLANEFLSKAQIRRDAGEAPAIEVVRARVETAQAANELRDARSDLVSAQANLNALLAREPGQQIVIRDSLMYQPFSPALETLKTNAIRSHPLLNETEAHVSAAVNLRKIAWGSFLPAVEIAAFRQNIDGNPGFYGMEIGLKIPLWFAFRQRGEIQEASALLHMQRSQLNESRLQILAEIESAYARFAAIREQTEGYQTELLLPAAELYRIARRSYETGESGYLQLLEAQQTLVDVRLAYVDLLERYYRAIAELEAAAGAIILEE